MRFAPFPVLAVSLAAVLAASVAAPAWSAPVMSIALEDILPMAPEFKKSLNLNPNQQLLWQQVESKTRATVRVRQQRREALQAALKKALTDRKMELRDAARQLDAEADLSHLEDQQLRELWLTMNDALDDAQRAQVVGFFAEQLERNFQGEPPKHDDSGERKRPEGGGKRGGQGGMGRPGISINN